MPTLAPFELLLQRSPCPTLSHPAPLHAPPYSNPSWCPAPLFSLSKSSSHISLVSSGSVNRYLHESLHFSYFHFPRVDRLLQMPHPKFSSSTKSSSLVSSGAIARLSPCFLQVLSLSSLAQCISNSALPSCRRSSLTPSCRPVPRVPAPIIPSILSRHAFLNIQHLCRLLEDPSCRPAPPDTSPQSHSSRTNPAILAPKVAAERQS